MKTITRTAITRSMAQSVRSRSNFVCLSVLLLSLVSTPPPARAQCDQCVTAAVATSASAVTAAIGQLEFTLHTQLYNIGHAIGSLITSNTALLQSIKTTNEKGFETLVSEDHARTSKQSSLAVKRDINEAFGAIAWNHCFEVETTLGATDSRTSAYVQALGMTKTFSGEIKANTKSPALRRRIMEEYFPEGVDFGRYFSPHQTLTELDMSHVPALTHVLSQSVVFPVAPAQDQASENDRTRYYRELKRERDTHGSIVEDVLARAILTNAPVVQAGVYVEKTLQEAGIDPSGYVQGDLTSETSLIKALGHSSFGNVATVRHSGLSGEELIRVLISEVGKTNYVLSKQYEAMKDIRFLQTLSVAKEMESFYQARLEQAFKQLH